MARSEEAAFPELGRFSAVSDLTGVYAGFVSDQPHRFFERPSRLHGRFQDFGECACAGDEGCVFELSW